MTRLLTAFALALASLVWLDARAQQPSFRAGTDAVSIYATVVDSGGRLVPNLGKDDFEIYDNGRRQPLTLFTSDRQPIAIVVMLDRSGSMQKNLLFERLAAEQFVRTLLPGDKARLGSFGTFVEIQPAEFTADKEKLLRMLQEGLQEGGPTPLWNATNAAMTALANQDGRRVVLVFTDGQDSPNTPGTNTTFDDVLDRSQRESVMIYGIGLA